MDANLSKALAVLAEKLGVSADQLWQVLVRQATTSACIDFTILWLVIISFVWWIFFVYKKTGGSNPDWHSGEAQFFAYASIFLSACILLVTTAVMLPDIINGVLSPEYWAAERLFLLLKAVL